MLKAVILVRALLCATACKPWLSDSSLALCRGLAMPTQNLEQSYFWHMIFLKQQTTLGKAPTQTKNRLPSIYKAVVVPGKFKCV